jgi:excinuclease ABC subunit B
MHSEIETLERIRLLRSLRKGRVRRPHRHQPPPRRPRPPRGLARRHPRRRQGRLPPLPGLPHPNHWPRRTPPRRPRHPLRRQDDRLHASRHRRNRSSPRKQVAYNEANGITPQTIIRAINDSLATISNADYLDLTEDDATLPDFATQADLDTYIANLESDMREAAKKFEFEKAAKLRDQVKELRTKEFLFS